MIDWFEVLRKMTWDEAEDEDAAKESWRDMHDPRDKPGKGRGGRKAPTSVKTEPFSNIATRRPGGQQLRKPEDEERMIAQRSGMKTSGTSGTMNTRDRRTFEAKRHREQKRLDAQKLRQKQAWNEARDASYTRHPGSLLDIEDMIDLENEAYVPDSHLEDLHGKRQSRRRLSTAEAEKDKLEDKILSGDYHLGDLAVDFTGDHEHILHIMQLNEARNAAIRAGLGFTISPEENDAMEELRSRHRMQGFDGLGNYRSEDHAVMDDEMSENWTGMDEAIARGKLGDAVDYYYYVDPDTGELKQGMTGELPAIDVGEYMRQGEEADPAGQRRWTARGDYDETDKDFDRGTFAYLPWNEETGFTRGEPIDIAFQVLKAPADWKDMATASSRWVQQLTDVYDNMVMGDPEARSLWNKLSQQDPETAAKVRESHHINQPEKLRLPSKPKTPNLLSMGRVGVSTQPKTQARGDASTSVLPDDLREAAGGQGIWFDEQGNMQIGSNPNE